LTAEAIDWAEWSREALAEMQARNQRWLGRFSLDGAPYRWDLDSATLTFTRAGDCVTADLCLIGTASIPEGTFRWAWAGDTPPIVTRGLGLVRSFGEVHDLPLLTTPEWPGGRAEGLEMLAAAGRIQDAAGVFVDQAGDLTLFFTLSNFRVLAHHPGGR
jgi:hypothetical protein